MDFLEQYLNRANEIIGDRTKDEERYDKEVLRWLRKGKGIKKAINKANQNYPGSALHKLSGDKKGLYAVKVSGNWRIFFEFIEGDAYIVDYDDYH